MPVVLPSQIAPYQEILLIPKGEDFVPSLALPSQIAPYQKILLLSAGEEDFLPVVLL